MKSSMFIISFLFAYSLTSLHNIKPMQSQNFWEWEAKIPITDSVSDNLNADLAVIEYIDNPSMNMVWENSSDENSSAILYQDLLNTNGPQVVASEPGVHFTHPKIVVMNYDSPNENFYVFYQSDQDGNEDIYFKKYGTDGQFTGPFPFATGEFDQENFTSEYFTYMGLEDPGRYIVKTMVWTSNGQLMTCDLEKNGDVFSFSEPVVLDEGPATDAYIYGNQIHYIKENEEGRFIYFIYRQYPTYVWSDPSIYFDQGNCYNLSGDHITPQYLTWSADSMGVYRNHIDHTYSQYNGYRIGPESDMPLDPAICTVILPIAPQPLEFYDFYMAFPYADSSNNEIFMNSMYQFPPIFENFSQSNTENRNPEFYSGEYDTWDWWCFWVYLTWEEYRNDHWQIFCSKTKMCVGGVEDDEGQPVQLSAFPNPFRDEISISFELSSKDIVRIEMYDLYGRKIKELYSGYREEGEQHITCKGIEVPSGIYLVSLQTLEIQSFIRVIKF